MSTSQKKPKIELFFKTESELRERVRFLASRGYTSYSLVNKNKEDKTINWCKAAIEEVQGATVTVHYSLKYNKPGGRQTPDEAQAASYTRFTKHLEKMDSMAFGSGAETLLISGSNPKTPLDSVTCLERLRKDINSSALAEEQCKSIGVAYNPYIPADDLASEERGRVEKKLKTGAVSSVSQASRAHTHTPEGIIPPRTDVSLCRSFACRCGSSLGTMQRGLRAASSGSNRWKASPPSASSAPSSSPQRNSSPR